MTTKISLKTKDSRLKTLSAFTLVELIVVIVILAILATIAFLSFSSQSASARDSTRLSDITNITKWLWIFQAVSGKLPMPELKIDIQASGTTIWYQWYAWANVLNMIKISNWWKDPLDNTTYYTYSTNSTQSKIQVLWFLEDWSNSAISTIPPLLSGEGWGEGFADPSSYTWRYVITKWGQLWILLNSTTLVPAQTANATIDVTTSTGTYTVQFTNKEKITWTWTAIYVVGSTMKTWWAKFPWCDQYNIVIWTQT
jgi:prepilin-type N-terminal cleavage/methylation domain-containing protein